MSADKRNAARRHALGELRHLVRAPMRALRSRIGDLTEQIAAARETRDTLQAEMRQLQDFDARIAAAEKSRCRAFSDMQENQTEVEQLLADVCALFHTPRAGESEVPQ